MSEYLRVPEGDFRVGSRVVVPWQDGVVFQCPCDARQVYVASPNHKIAFDGADRLTLSPSCGYRARGGKPANWCHFWIRAGVPEMCGDAQCPGVGA